MPANTTELLAWWGNAFRMKRITPDYLRGYAHALRDAGIITEEKEKSLLKQLENRDLYL